MLERHPEVDQKIGVGIDHFSVRDALYGTRCFEVARTDSSTTDFSFGSCVNGKAPSRLTEALNALRAEVAEDILKKKREWFREHGNAEGKVACAISGTYITIEEAHADHAPPRSFGTLAIAFLTAHSIQPGPDLVTPPADNQYQPLLVDRALAERWRRYHHEIAVIRIVARGENLTRGHEGKVKKRDQQLRLK
ncbi:DCL family protein [Bradyrhizobium sp. RT3a]|uniref:DCL family protein n=1 Tax=unclassified Bradyrhizobium TaxID=2631580 RepID=UPI003396174B